MRIIPYGPRLQQNVVVACSAGVDSMAALDVIRRRRNVTVAYFHHGHGEDVAYRNKCLDFIKKWCDDKQLALVIGYNNVNQKPKHLSIEEHWRYKRYEFFHSFNMPVITAHHLDDSVENWVWTSMHGNGEIIPYKNQNVVRPFLFYKKEDMKNYCVRMGVDWIEDESNTTDLDRTRNYIRNVMMTDILKINPGIHKVIRKKIMAHIEEHKNNYL